MSREFGSYSTGYFHELISLCASDAHAGYYEITRKWGAALKAMEQIAYSISSAEAGDSAAYDPIWRSLQDLPRVRAALTELENYLLPFRDIAELAIREEAIRREDADRRA